MLLQLVFGNYFCSYINDALKNEDIVVKYSVAASEIKRVAEGTKIGPLLHFWKSINIKSLK